MIRFYNSLSRSYEEFKPLKDNTVTLYTCGPTVYNYPHIGNLRTFLFEDLLKRTLIYAGYNVKHVMNITDVDDKTIKGAINENISLKEYTDRYKKAFFEDIEALNILKADYYPCATEYITEMIKIIEKLIEKGHAYVSEDGVYFKIDTFKEYGKLSHFNKDELKSGASGRVNSDEYEKENVSDFALWKKWTKDDGDFKWNSPWGEGRPGWHIECSAMSMALLGETIDIHCGGIDNLFPHHENEIAQSEAFSGKKFVNYWLHSVHLIVNGEKMAKSKGNFFTLRDLQNKGFSNRSIRYALITTHYRKPLNFTFDLVKQADSSLKRIDDFIFTINNKTDLTDKPYFSELINKTEDGFRNSLFDDLNISEALSFIFEMINQIYNNINQLSKDDVNKINNLLKNFDRVLGFNFYKDNNNELPAEILNLLNERIKAKKEKDFKRADEIRNLLLEKGYEVRDTKEGQICKRIIK